MTLAAVVRQRLGAEGGAEVPWSRARGLCTRGKVSRRRRAGARLRRCASSADRRCAVDERAPVPKPESAATIVFEDAHVVVIDKPTGISSVPYEKREQRHGDGRDPRGLAPSGAARHHDAAARRASHRQGDLGPARVRQDQAGGARAADAVSRARRRADLPVRGARARARSADRVAAGDRSRRRAARLDARGPGRASAR